MPFGRAARLTAVFLAALFALSGCHITGHGFGIPPGQIIKQGTPAGGAPPPGQAKKVQ